MCIHMKRYMFVLSSKISWCFWLIVLYCKYLGFFPICFLNWEQEKGWQFQNSNFIDICVAALCCCFASLAFSFLIHISQFVELFGVSPKKSMCIFTNQVLIPQLVTQRPELHASIPSARWAECPEQEAIYDQLPGNTKCGSSLKSCPSSCYLSQY